MDETNGLYGLYQPSLIDPGSDLSAGTFGNTASGFFQNLATIGSGLATTGAGYLSKRLDIDLYSRAQGAMAYPQLRTTQNGLLLNATGVPQPGGVGTGSATLLNLNAVLPFLIVGGLVYFLAK